MLSVKWLLFSVLVLVSLILILLKLIYDLSQETAPPPPFEVPIRYVPDEQVFVIRWNENFLNHIVVGCYVRKDDIDRLAYLGVLVMNGSVGSLRLLGLAASLIFSVMACLLLTKIYGDIRYLALATVVVAIATFLGFLDIGLEAKKRISLSNSDMRTAIAASFIVTYLTIAGLVIFFTDNAASTLPEIARLMLTNFTATVGIVIAFYFGATAYVDSKRLSRN